MIHDCDRKIIIIIKLYELQIIDQFNRFVIMLYALLIISDLVMDVESHTQFLNKLHMYDT